jgi:hypothetical protein
VPAISGLSNKTVIYFGASKYLSQYVRSPVPLGQGLVQIGGFFAILKISLMGLFFFNKAKFEKKMYEAYNEQHLGSEITDI